MIDNRLLNKEGFIDPSEFSDHGEYEDEDGKKSNDVVFSQEGRNDSWCVMGSNGIGGGLAGEGEHDDKHEDEVLHI